MKKHIFTLGATALVSIGIADAASADTDTHKVKAGETLFSISQQHNVTVEDLKKWNGLSSTLIYANQTLQIGSTSTDSSSSSTPTTTSSNHTYTVKSGDTLYRIAKNNGTSVQQLKEWNNISSHLIYVNQVLKISGTGTVSSSPSAPVQEKTNETQASPAPSNSKSYKVQPGDTMWSVAQRHGISISQLKQWNNLSSNTIYINQVLQVGGQAAAQAKPSTPATTAPSIPSTSTSTPAPAPAQERKSVSKEITVEATAYTAYCAGCSGITATGIDLRSNPNRKVIAVDPRVIPLGSRVYVEGYGEAIAGDTGGAIKGTRVDLFMASQSSALNWGRKTVKLQILD
ncbi:LysM peptidoglycan-binding domain-containing protein [Priestia megaterium]|uniref:Cell wall-binding protein yocH n=1 Tax=Priestia megaterium (strain ATCC 14581 / DSM 32 / CCUG 1817 / JCM 2506 / NBRC 15308 / NCIMB 9376 / NCTC 10342 / NRRL B-14308 / VKM B-512 / Ford 19) TaxID=1348623 RepID=A0A0B6ATD9_PRIM2|nr:LysM peptidoglycan-binding and 3D domain-containing protein [Priestia megaterium]AJI23124.1 cell wall-binding protein yocH [Priestia megaterium NBRC 15308 = ATCC 14581]KFM96546.1 cell wall-binding protein yocH [Priestia megaterium]MDR4231402.1 LysM peptidoglycan-binding domain-containing protein [Priestia megaterium]MED3807669.1 LysM peptidoglycan-binding domain-containing protein [Priestia megaterium]MED4396865.1 LysM peptidoglycan-binding domain-containing protein [Priestia megaterium]